MYHVHIPDILTPMFIYINLFFWKYFKDKCHHFIVWQGRCVNRKDLNILIIIGQRYHADYNDSTQNALISLIPSEIGLISGKVMKFPNKPCEIDINSFIVVE